MRISMNCSMKTKLALFGALLAVAALLSLCAGASGVSLLTAIREPDSAAARILVHIRLPRVAAAMLYEEKA